MRKPAQLRSICCVMTGLLDDILTPAVVEDDEVVAPPGFDDVVTGTGVYDVVLPAVVYTIVTVTHEVHLLAPGTLDDIGAIGAFDD